MDISEYTTEDFVLDPSFKKWILYPDAPTNLKWDQLLSKYPKQRWKAAEARDILINLSMEKFEMKENKKDLLWQEIQQKISYEKHHSQEGKVVPLNARSTLSRLSLEKKTISWSWLRSAGFVGLLIGLGFLFFKQLPVEPEVMAPMVFEERSTTPGTKTHLKLADGTLIILNSNSKIKFPRNFGPDKREVILEGEAFFEVAKDSLRPFSVQVGHLKTLALGTSFNIREYPEGNLEIALVSGEVAVSSQDINDEIRLKPGEMVRGSEKGLTITSFDEDRIIAWTKKIILFKDTPLAEAIGVLENWYGVKFNLKQVASGKVTFSGKYHDETLENVLKGLSFVGKFKYNIDKEKVTITFH